MRIQIISGGQTGVDRAALDLALEIGLPCGGWCPLGRRAEDGRLDDRYPLQETDSPDYAVRTEANVALADATLILTHGQPDGGTALTERLARKRQKPCLVVDLQEPCDPAAILRWIEENEMQILNVAGPRERSQPGVYDEASLVLRAVFTPLARRDAS